MNSYQLPKVAIEWQQKIRNYVDSELIPHEVEAELNGGELPEVIRSKHWQWASSLCLGGQDAPKEYGGLELTHLEQIVISEQLGRATNALGWCFHEAHRWMFDACTEQQIKDFFVPIMKNTRRECYAITESESGSDVDGIHATAKLDGDEYVLNGEKWYVTSANIADFAIFQAKLVGGKHDGDHALFFVELDNPNIEEVDNPPFAHTFEAHHPTLKFKDVRIPAKNLIGEEGDGMGFTYAWFRHERVRIAARCCGAAERLIEEVTDFAKNRIVSGEPIANYQMIQAMLAESATELWAARLMTYEAAEAHDRGEDVKVLHAKCSMAKLYASEMVNRVADRAVQIFGGRGYMKTNVAERFYREVRVDRIWEGTSEIQKLIIANSLYKRGIEGLYGRVA